MPANKAYLRCRALFEPVQMLWSNAPSFLFHSKTSWMKLMKNILRTFRINIFKREHFNWKMAVANSNESFYFLQSWFNSVKHKSKADLILTLVIFAFSHNILDRRQSISTSRPEANLNNDTLSIIDAKMCRSRDTLTYKH